MLPMIRVSNVFESDNALLIFFRFHACMISLPKQIKTNGIIVFIIVVPCIGIRFKNRIQRNVFAMNTTFDIE